MATIPVIDYIADVIEDSYVTLKEVVANVSKNIQEYVDSIAIDPLADNSHDYVVMPKQFSSPAFFYLKTTYITNAYNAWNKGYGQQYWGCYVMIEINNDTISLTDGQLLGRVPNGMTWDYLNSEDIATITPLMKNALDSLNPVFSSDNPVYWSYGNILGTGYFKKSDNDSDISWDEELPYKSITGGSNTFAFTSTNIQYDEDTDYWSGINVDYGGAFSCPYKMPFMLVTTQENAATDYVAQNNATHNYVKSYTGTGGSMKLYYGDNYMIYVIPSGTTLSYDDFYTITKEAGDKISEDNPSMPKIYTPTYDENKYGPEPEYDDDNFGLTTTGFSSNIGGAGNYWLMDLATLAGFISDFKTTAPAGSMISQNILSCYVNALNYEWETGKDNIVIHAAGAQNTPYTSTSQYDYIYQYNPHVVVGQYKVPRVTETFYDFNPYSTYELYIPFCGWIGLPDTVAGRNIRVYMDFDVATMSCKAYVMVEMEDGSGSTICGEITGSFGAPCPVQVIEGGLYKQAMINSGLQIASGVVSGLMGGAFGGPVGASMLATGGMNAVQGLASAYMAGNTNYGQTIGRTGDTSGLCGGHYCYIKITHPVIDEVVDTETFGHTTGYPCYMESELSALAGTGFTVCLNPHVHVNCTQNEKEEIKQLLESGVIL